MRKKLAATKAVLWFGWDLGWNSPTERLALGIRETSEIFNCYLPSQKVAEAGQFNPQEPGHDFRHANGGVVALQSKIRWSSCTMECALGEWLASEGETIEVHPS